MNIGDGSVVNNKYLEFVFEYIEDRIEPIGNHTVSTFLQLKKNCLCEMLKK